MINGILYCNDGDWVESRSALVEHQDGTLELIYWDQVLDFLPVVHSAVPMPDRPAAPVAAAAAVAAAVAAVASEVA